jgi:hypothetical protein
MTVHTKGHRWRLISLPTTAVRSPLTGHAPHRDHDPTSSGVPGDNRMPDLTLDSQRES